MPDARGTGGVRLWRASLPHRHPRPSLVHLPGLGPHSTGRTAGQRLLQRIEVLGLSTTFDVWLVARRGFVPGGTTIADLADEHARAIRSRFAQPVDVVGESTGGSIALRLAIDHPDVVRRLVLVSAAAHLARQGERAQEEAAAEVRAGRRRRAAATILETTTRRPALRALLRVAGYALGRLVIGRDDRELARLIDAEDGFDVEEDLGRVVAPTLLIGGAEDGYYSPALLARTAARIPEAEHLELPGKGHLSAMVDADVRRAIRAHLR
ncbi:alpha/beta hydrolase [Amnibacterium sp. CER49]|uniref:alpha/beta fold hydrolase n=1 Tax=Amnibacterium sp. CER49 TaxID=3039161 RepID=UPI00244923F5|nr:alpha/beta hydrolase [Amnibacterium sp. CER49]MDH2443504.1 alpha/beta hydrolase [Amnibacterium sp. CER49]